MSRIQHNIPYYNEINDFLESIPSDYRTSDPLLFCLRLKQNESSIHNYKPPFRKAFYFIALVTNAGQTEITFDNTNVGQLDSFLVFQAPGLLYSFFRDNRAHGYLIYFKKECFSFFRPELENEFPFFNILQTNFFKINQAKFREFSPWFEEVFMAFEKADGNHHPVAVVKLLTLLYQLKDFATAHFQWQKSFSTPQQILFQKFLQLVNNYYIEKKTVEEYAGLLHVTPNHLSQSIKLATGRNALAYINDRILNEAKSLIRYTDFDIAEISYRLNFTDPANFGKFFKKHCGLTPLDFRKKGGGEFTS